MKISMITLRDMAAGTAPEIQQEIALSMELSDRICELMNQRGLSKKDLANALGKRPSEITRWISGQHNFTLRTISLISKFFGESLVRIAK